MKTPHLFYLLLLLFVSPAYAAWYQVEVIVFDYLSPSSDGELWYENPGLPGRSNSIELITELADGGDPVTGTLVAGSPGQDLPGRTTELIPYLELPGDKLRLAGVYRVLKLSSEYRPLFHVAWQQPGLSPRSARSVHLQKLRDSAAPKQPGPMNTTAGDVNGTNNNSYEAVYEVLDLVFDGTVRLRSTRFLHVDVDIAYFPESHMKAAVVDKEQDKRLFAPQHADYVRLQESRKIKLNEIHYFDHPVFGVILRVSRLTRD